MSRKSRNEITRSRLSPGQSLRELSPIADQLVGQNSDDLRIDKVMELREAINAGSYDVDQRVNDLLGKLETNLSGLVQAEADTQPLNDTDSVDNSKSFEEFDTFDNDDFQDEFESLDALNENEDFDDQDDFDDEDDRY